MIAAAPTPTNAPNADAIFIIGIVSAIPEIANAPTPCPIKILSIILNSDVEIIAIIAGIAYRGSSFDNGSVPSESVDICFFIRGAKIVKLCNIDNEVVRMEHHPHLDRQIIPDLTDK